MYAATVQDVPELGVRGCDSLAGVLDRKPSPLPLAVTGSAPTELVRGVVLAVAVADDQGAEISAADEGPNMVRSHATWSGLKGLAI